RHTKLSRDWSSDVCSTDLLIINFAVQSCKEEPRMDYIGSNGGAPAQVSNVVVENTPGGAILKYKLNKDVNLSYVKAVYEVTPGRSEERRVGKARRSGNTPP